MSGSKAISDTKPTSLLIRSALTILLAVTALAATASLILLYGFRELPWPVAPAKLLGRDLAPADLLALAQAAIAGIFVLERFLRFLTASAPARYFRQNWIDYALPAGAVIAAVLGLPNDARWCMMALIIATALHSLALPLLQNIRACTDRGRPIALLFGAFVILILAAAGLLMLPAALKENASRLFWIDALFAATSAMCLAGLSVRNIALDFSPFGQAIILCLIQIGALSIMTFAALVVARIAPALDSQYDRLAAGPLDSPVRANFARVAAAIAALTLLAEVIGAACLYPMFADAYAPDGQAFTPAQALWQSVFHSVSAFCNAGFSLQPDSLVSLRDHWQVPGIVAPLIILGGLGYPVLGNVAAALVGRARLSAYSRLALATTFLLIALGAGGLMLVESMAGNHSSPEKTQIRGAGSGQVNDWQSMDDPQRLRESLFLSVSARTAGLRTFDITQLTDSAKALLCGLMMIGGTLGGAAGGMTTLTLALLTVTVISTFRRRHLRADPGPYAGELLRTALTLAFLYLLLLGLTTVLLTAAVKSQGSFLDLLLEATSACSQVGLSTGITPSLNVQAKNDLIGAMLLGRLGPVILLMALSRRFMPAPRPQPQETLQTA